MATIAHHQRAFCRNGRTGRGLRKQTQAQKLVERDNVAYFIGEISSACARAIGEQALRYKKVFINTGANSDALRASNCNRYMSTARTRCTRRPSAPGRTSSSRERSGISWSPTMRARAETNGTASMKIVDYLEKGRDVRHIAGRHVGTAAYLAFSKLLAGSNVKLAEIATRGRLP